jgi:hypothetical protein
MFYISALWSNYACSVETLEIQVYLIEIFKKILILTKSGLTQKQSNSSSKVKSTASAQKYFRVKSICRTFQLQMRKVQP